MPLRLPTALTTPPLNILTFLILLPFHLLPLPLVAICSAFPSLRAVQTWTYRQTMGVYILGVLVELLCVARLGTRQGMGRGREGDRWVVMQQKENALYVGPMRGRGCGEGERSKGKEVEDEKGRVKGAEKDDRAQEQDTTTGDHDDEQYINTVQPAPVGGTWYPSPLSAADVADTTKPTIVVLHLHGGAFTLNDGRTLGTSYMTTRLLKYTPATHVLAPQYRLSTLPVTPISHAFPAALQDSLTAYLHLTKTLGLPAVRIILSGDSAGGNLAIALLRYIATYGAQLGLDAPAAALLWSPWIDASDASPAAVTENSNYATDYVPPSLSNWGSKAYTGLLPPAAAAANPYINHKLHHFRTPTRIWTCVGGREVLFHDATMWTRAMEGAGCVADVESIEEWPHDVVPLGNLLGWAQEVKFVVVKAGEWVREALKARELEVA